MLVSGLVSIHFYQFNSIPIRRKMQISQFQFNSIHLKEINVQFQFNSIHKLFNSNSNPIPYHRYFIRVALLKFHSTQLISAIPDSFHLHFLSNGSSVLDKMAVASENSDGKLFKNNGSQIPKFLTGTLVYHPPFKC